MQKTVDDLSYRGTTTVGAISKHGIVLATDTRVTMGSMVMHKKGKKVYKIANHLAMTISGVVADAQQTVQVLKANARIYRLERKKPIPVGSAARIVANLFFSNRFSPFIAQLIIAGKDNAGYHLFSIDPFGSVTEEKCLATGSGSPVAYGLLEELYRENLTLEELLPIVVKAIKSAVKRDVASGDGFDISVIDEIGYHELSCEEKERIFKKN
jgi:proteasome beta subunit